MSNINLVVEKIGLEDFYLGSGTFSRATSTGGTQSITKLNTSDADLTKLHDILSSANDINAMLYNMAAMSKGSLLVGGASAIEGITAVATSQYLLSQGVSTAPTFGKLALSLTGTHTHFETLDATEDVVVSCGFKPSVVFILATNYTSGERVISLGVDVGTQWQDEEETMSGRRCIRWNNHSLPVTDTTYSFYVQDYSHTYTHRGYISSTTSTSYVLSITKNDSISSTSSLFAIALP